MTAHVIYEALDPDLPATLSPIIIKDVIRDVIGFDGLLLTDDLFMDALAPFGDVPERARKAVEAGCDIALHCHGSVAEREKALKAVGKMRADTRTRLRNWKKS
jgi:beta-N-acetylhexosaminidase